MADWTKIIKKLEYGRGEEFLSYFLNIVDYGFKHRIIKKLIDYDFSTPTRRIDYMDKNLYKAYKLILESDVSKFDSLDVMVEIIEGLERLRDDYRARLINLNLSTEDGIGDAKKLYVEFIIYDEEDKVNWENIFLP